MSRSLKNRSQINAKHPVGFCAWCGKPITKDNDFVLLKTVTIGPSTILNKGMWHSGCFNKVNSLGHNETGTVDNWLRLAEGKESLPVEQDKDWEKWVARPVISHILAPRQARAALEIVGTLADKGHSVSEMLGLLAAIVYLGPTGVSGKEGGASLRKIFGELGTEEDLNSKITDEDDQHDK